MEGYVLDLTLIDQNIISEALIIMEGGRDGQGSFHRRLRPIPLAICLMVCLSVGGQKGEEKTRRSSCRDDSVKRRAAVRGPSLLRPS